MYLRMHGRRYTDWNSPMLCPELDMVWREGFHMFLNRIMSASPIHVLCLTTHPLK